MYTHSCSNSNHRPRAGPVASWFGRGSTRDQTRLRAEATHGDLGREAHVSAGDNPKSGSTPATSRRGTNAARAYRIGYSGSGSGRSVSHASRRGAERPMVSGVATPLHVTQPELGRLQAT